MATIPVPWTGVVGSTLTFQYGCTPVGSGAILNDASAATYASYGGGGGNVFSPTPAPGSTVNGSAPLEIHAVLDTDIVIGENFEVSWVAQGYGGIASYRFIFSGTAGLSHDPDGSLRVPLALQTSAASAAAAINGGGGEAQFSFLMGPARRLYEARFEVVWMVRDAPPCRRFPREDRLGLGGGNRARGGKSQQRSGRRFGYY